jgi:proteasome lid subunit RPN8/RPN11
MTDSDLQTNRAAPMVLNAEQVQAIYRHAEATYPDECCGVILGQQVDRQRVVAELIEIENQWDEEERRRRFLITPKQYMQAEKQAREARLDLLGFYHSHPDAPARPSEFDREHAWPFYTYLIAGVAAGKTVELTGWQLRDDRSGYEQVEMDEMD